MAVAKLQDDQVSVEDYIFGNPVTLSAGQWELAIESGHAWVFCERGDFVLNTHETMVLFPNDGEATIRGLYVKSVVKFKATRFAS